MGRRRRRRDAAQAALQIRAGRHLQPARQPRRPGRRHLSGYLVIKNLAGPDELLSARARISRRAVLARRGTEPLGTSTLPALAIPARSTTSLSPLGPDIVLIDPGALQVGAAVPVTLTFRNAGRITVDFTVTPAGTP
jgi:copper(I)-binding protein